MLVRRAAQKRSQAVKADVPYVLGTQSCGGYSLGWEVDARLKRRSCLMQYVLKSGKYFFAAFCCVCLLVTALVDPSEAGPINCQVRGAAAGQVRDGKQLIGFEATFRNSSQVEYISRVNWVEVRVHGYFRGREESYTRKVDVNWDFLPPLEPGQRKNLRIRFKRSVQPQRGSFPYDDVEIQVLNINFKRAS